MALFPKPPVLGGVLLEEVVPLLELLSFFVATINAAVYIFLDSCPLLLSSLFIE